MKGSLNTLQLRLDPQLVLNQGWFRGDFLLITILLVFLYDRKRFPIRECDILLHTYDEKESGFKPFTFKLRFRHDDYVALFAAETEEELEAWLDALDNFSYEQPNESEESEVEEEPQVLFLMVL